MMTTRRVQLEQRAYEHLRDQQRYYEDQSITLTTRVATWLIVANAAMLVALFNAVVQHQVHDANAILPVARWFAFGLCSAFAGACFLLVSLVRNGQAMITKLDAGVRHDFAIAELQEAESAEAPLPLDSPVRKKLDDAVKLGNRMNAVSQKLWRYTLTAWVMLALSAVATAGGVFSPLMDPSIVRAIGSSPAGGG